MSLAQLHEPVCDEAPVPHALVQRYLDHVRFEKRLAARTVTLYALDLDKLSGLARTAGVDLLQVQASHVRRWVAQMHGGGRSGRGIALILSGWRGFYTWLGRESLVDSNPVLDVRSPKAAKPLPKALNVDDAVHLASFHGNGDPWLEARDAAMVELLYGAGIRLGELTGLDVQASAPWHAAGLIWMRGRPTCWEKAASGALSRWAPRRCRPCRRWLLARGQGLQNRPSQPCSLAATARV
jgi:integrase/recombinase XerC